MVDRVHLHDSGIWSVCHLEGLVFATGARDGCIGLVDFASGKQERNPCHDGWVRSVAYAPDDNVLASSSEDLTIRLWKRDGLTLSALGDPGTVHTARPTCVSFSTDGSRLVSSGQDGTVSIWKTQGRLRHEVAWNPPLPYEGTSIHRCSGIDPATARSLEHLGADLLESASHG